MNIRVDGFERQMTPEEVEKFVVAPERDYWQRPYEELVSEKIHEMYSYDAELAILRQRDQKPDEYKAYFEYCEQCKEFVRQKQFEHNVMPKMF